MDAAVDVPVVPVVVVVPVVLVVGVDVEAVVLVEVLGVLILVRGEKFTGMLKLLRAAPNVRVISLETCNTSTSTTTSDLGLSRS